MPNAGTDAHDLFSGKLGLQSNFAYGSGSGTALLSFSNLPEGRYEVALTLNRGSSMGLTRLSLQGAAAFTAASSEGIHDAGDSDPATVALDSNNTAMGHVAQWTDIEPIDGAFSILVDRHSGNFFYLPQLIRLQAEPLSVRITSQPQDVTVAYGESATLSVAALAGQGILSHQWYRGESGDKSQPIPGAEQATLALEPQTDAGAFAYWVEVSDYLGTLASDTATVTVLEPDSIPPEPITDLTVTEVTHESISVSWSAPYDDGSGAAQYELRRGHAPLTEANFHEAHLISGLPAPAAAGTAQSFTVTGLEPETTYYLALRTHDHAGNVSEISNSVSTTTSAVPVGVLIEDFEAASVSTTTATHYPEHAGWYGVAGVAVREEGGPEDGAYLEIKRASRNPAYAGVFLSTAELGLEPGTAYTLQFDVKIGTEGLGLIAPDASLRYTLGENNGGNGWGSRIGDTLAELFTAHGGTSFLPGLYRRKGPGVTVESEWQRYTSTQTFSFETLPPRIFIGFQTLGIGAAGTLGADYSYVGVANVSFILHEEDEPAPTGPSISSQPAGSTIPAGGTATLSVAAVSSGGALQYQWYQGQSGDTSMPVGSDSPNFTTPVLTETTSYWVTVSDDHGSVSSATATVTVESLVAQPLRILWFGNSLSPGQIRQTVTALAEARGIPGPVYAVQQLFGADLAAHLDKLDEDGAGNLIDSLPAGQHWDVVVIQGSSTESSTLYGDTRAAFEADALALFTRVRDRSPQVRALLYEVWTRPPHNFPGTPYTGGATPEQFQAEIRASHANIAQAIQTLGNAADVAPVGTAMEHFNFFEPLLFNQDYHLSQQLGRIFAGMVLFNSLYSETVSDVVPASAPLATLLADFGHSAAEWTWMAPYADDPYFQSLRIDTQPRDAFVVLNGSTTLEVAATTPHGILTHQWYQGESGDTAHPVAGADAASFTPSPFDVAGAYAFWVRVGNGSETRDSRTAVLTVREPDLTPPDAVTDLGFDSVSGGRVSLAWTAPADIGWGTEAYEIRYSTSPISSANFADAQLVPNPPIPGIPGSTDHVDVLGLQAETDYWFALHTRDEAGNWSALSNVLSVRTLAPVGNVLVDDFNTGSGALPASSNIASTVQADWRGIPSSASSGFVRHQDGHLRIHRTWRNTQRQGVGIWLRVADYPGLVPSETYHLRFNYAVGSEGGLDYRNNAWLRYSVGQRTVASYVEARTLDSATGPTLNNANAAWSAINFEEGPDVTGERPWNTHTSEATFTLEADADLIFLHFVAQGFGIESSTADWDSETAFTWLGLDDVIFVAAGAAPAGPVILSQPQSVTVGRGEETVLAVSAETTTASMGFQWFRGERGDESQPVPGAVSSNLTVPGRHHAGTHAYWVRVSDDEGVVFSETAVVTVLVPDSDGDGLPDWWEEMYYFGPTAAPHPDTPAANPRLTIRQAYTAGLDPADPDAELDLLQTLQHGNPTLSWTASEGRVYRVRESYDLREGFETILATGLRDGTYTPPAASQNGPRFFRIEVMLDED